MADRLKGCSGIFKVRDTSNAEIIVVDTDTFSLSESAESETFQVHGDCAEQVESSTTKYELSLGGVYSTDNPGQVLLKNGSKVEWVFYLDSGITDGSGPSWGGIIAINGLERDAPADGKVTFSLSGTGDGQLILTNTW